MLQLLHRLYLIYLELEIDFPGATRSKDKERERGLFVCFQFLAKVVTMPAFLHTMCTTAAYRFFLMNRWAESSVIVDKKLLLRRPPLMISPSTDGY